MQKEPTGTPPPTRRRLTPSELDQLFKRMEKMRQDLEEKLQEIFQKSGKTRQQLENYLNNPNNFTPQQWAIVENGRKRIEEKVSKAIGVQQKGLLEKKQRDKAAKGRKGKTLGGRRKWISVR